MIEVDGQASTLIVEAHWASVVGTMRRNGALPGIRRLWFILRVLPYLLPALIAPRFHETPGNGRSSTPHSRRRWLASLRSDADEIVSLAPTMARALTLYTVLFGTGLALTALPPLAAVGVFVVAFVALVAFLGSSRDVSEHVRLATLADGELRPVLDRIAASLDLADEQCEEIWVIGHSQGGYLAHRLLADRANRWPAVRRFTGVASGVRPIRLVSDVTDRAATAAWMTLLSAVLVAIGVVLLFEPGAPLNTPGSKDITLFTLAATVSPSVLLSFPTAFAGDSWRDLIPTNWSFVLFFAAGYAGTALAKRVNRSFGDGPAPVPDLPSVIDWQELSARGDVVGSMSVPELPASAQQVTIPSVNSPVLDHLLTSYLGARSILRFDLAVWMTRRSNRHIENLRTSLTHLSESNYVFRVSAQILFVVTVIGLPMSMGVPPLAIVPAVIVPGILLAAVTAVWTFTRWRRGSSERISAFAVGTATKVSPVYPARIVRSRKSLVASSLTALFACLGGVSMFLVAAIGDLSRSAVPPVLIEQIRSSGTHLLLAALAAMVGWCLGVAGARGVRAWLAFACFSAALSLLALVAAGEAWAVRLFPGGHIALLVLVGCVLALAWSRRRPVAP